MAYSLIWAIFLNLSISHQSEDALTYQIGAENPAQYAKNHKKGIGARRFRLVCIVSIDLISEFVSLTVPISRSINALRPKHVKHHF